MRLEGLYAITDTALLPGESLLSAVQEALEGGISLLQYRDKQSSRQTRREQAKTLQALCARYAVPLIINDDLELCLECGAAGVHLGQQDTDLVTARSRLGDQAIIGVSCHGDLELARRAEQAGASYVAFGRFFPSRTKPQAPPASPDILTRAKTQLTVPIAAIGGIDAANAAGLIAAGADMLAVINYLFATDRVRSRAQILSALFENPEQG